MIQVVCDRCRQQLLEGSSVMRVAFIENWPNPGSNWNPNTSLSAVGRDHHDCGADLCVACATELKVFLKR